MTNGIKLPPSALPPRPASSGTTGTQSALQPNKPAPVNGPTAPQAPTDQFGKASTSAAATAQLTGRDGVRLPGQLASDLKKILDAGDLPGRLSADLAIHLPELISLLSLTRQEKATRLMEFLVPYAEKLATLAQQQTAEGKVPRAELEQQMLQPMREAGLEHVVETTTGQSGVEVAEQMLAAQTPEEARAVTENMKFDAPTWASRPEAQAQNEVQRGEPALLAQNVVAAPQPRAAGRAPELEEEQKKKDKGRDKVLGGNMVWNALHMFRGDDADALDPKKQKELLMATGGIIVMVVVVAVAITLALIFK